jgi:four helix bundle protein
VKDFRRLTVWEKSHALTLRIYRITSAFPREEIYGLTSQLRRCSSSVAANIAEGCGRTGNGESHRFLNIAAGSLVEVEYFLLLSRDLNFISAESYANLQKDVLEVERMLASLLRKFNSARLAQTSDLVAHC